MLTEIEINILQRIEDQSIQWFADGHRKHLGGSEIGESCLRKLWYKFRWFSPNIDETEENIGRKLRLFNRGHREEPFFIELLQRIGCKITDTQRRFSDCEGHFGGSLDAVGTLPTEYGILGEVFFEFKTMNQNNFTLLKKEGLRLGFPKYWAQVHTYGTKTNLPYCLFLSVNKNDDSIHVQLIPIDRNYGQEMLEKSLFVITNPEPPAKISLSPTDFRCKWCQAREICHYKAEPLKNCRTCQFSKPISDGKWHCELHRNEIPENFVPVGCDNWSRADR